MLSFSTIWEMRSKKFWTLIDLTIPLSSRSFVIARVNFYNWHLSLIIILLCAASSTLLISCLHYIFRAALHHATLQWEIGLHISTAAAENYNFFSKSCLLLYHTLAYTRASQQAKKHVAKFPTGNDVLAHLPVFIQNEQMQLIEQERSP